MRRKCRPILRRVGSGVLGVLHDIDNKNKYFDELLGYSRDKKQTFTRFFSCHNCTLATYSCNQSAMENDLKVEIEK